MYQLLRKYERNGEVEEETKEEEEEGESLLSPTEKAVSCKGNQDLIIVEEKIDGSMGWSSYKKYLGLSKRWWLNILIFLLTLAPAGIGGAMRLFIANWVTLSTAQQGEPYYKWVYIVLTVMTIVSAICSSIGIVSLSLSLSQTLHNKMLESVTRAPMEFFDSNPLGRIINRFSKDTACADGAVPLQVIVLLGVSSL